MRSRSFDQNQSSKRAIQQQPPDSRQKPRLSVGATSEIHIHLKHKEPYRCHDQHPKDKLKENQKENQYSSSLQRSPLGLVQCVSIPLRSPQHPSPVQSHATTAQCSQPRRALGHGSDNQIGTTHTITTSKQLRMRCLIGQSIASIRQRHHNAAVARRLYTLRS